MDKTPARKISAATVIGKIPNPPEKGSAALLQVIGRASGYRTGEKDHGDGPRPWWGLLGIFEAVNIETGEVFTAPQCFLPEPFGSGIANQLKNGAESVDFALELGITQGKNTRYEWTSKPLQDPTAADPLEALRGRAPALAKVLPAPDTEAEGDGDTAKSSSRRR